MNDGRTLSLDKNVSQKDLKKRTQRREKNVAEIRINSQLPDALSLNLLFFLDWRFFWHPKTVLQQKPCRRNAYKHLYTVTATGNKVFRHQVLKQGTHHQKSVET